MKNEHRKIANELQLFNLSDYSQGMAVWLPKGQYIYQKIESYLRNIQNEYGYNEVQSPIVANSELWKKSGHLSNFKDNMFFVEDSDNAIKPMNCPFHIDIFKQLSLSYKDLPYRISEFGLCHRNEASGALNGLFRLRQFKQDDGHIFCQKEDIEKELIHFVKMLKEVYLKFGFDEKNISVKIALRPENRIGDDELWDLSEKLLMQGLDKLNIKYDLLEGEGAFYGAKIEFGLKDSLNREWQCGVFQLDFLLAKRLGASFINKEGKEEYPVILHRAVLGSIERFIAILLEHYNGKLPLFLNPNAISIIPINENCLDYVNNLKFELNKLGIFCDIDQSNNSVGYKVKSAFKKKSNFSIIIGEKEVNENIISLRDKKRNYSFSLEELKDFLLNEN